MKYVVGQAHYMMQCHRVFFIYNDDTDEMLHIIGPKMSSSGTMQLFYDYVTGCVASNEILPHILGRDNWDGPSENDELEVGDSDVLLGLLMDAAREWTDELLASIVSGVTVFSKSGAIRILNRASPLWQGAVNAILRSPEILDNVQVQTPGLSGDGAAAQLLKQAKAAAKWLSRAGYVFTAIAVADETHSVWVETGDWKVTLATAVEGTIKVFVLAAIITKVGAAAIGLATVAVIAGAPALAVVAAVVVGVLILSVVLNLLWEFTGLGDAITNVLEGVFSDVSRWATYVKQKLPELREKLAEVRRSYSESLEQTVETVRDAPNKFGQFNKRLEREILWRFYRFSYP